jgi:hypothetical protein
MRVSSVALGLVAAAFAVQAQAKSPDPLSFAAQSTVSRSETFNPAGASELASLAANPVTLGQLLAPGAGTLSFSYLGQESGYKNELHFAGQVLTEDVAVGSTISAPVSAGAVAFSFIDQQGGVARNVGANGGTEWLNDTSIALLGRNVVLGGQSYQMVLGFNDRGGAGATLGDWDDYVVGANFVAAPVPEPTSLALLGLGLGVIALAKRRRSA